MASGTFPSRDREAIGTNQCVCVCLCLSIEMCVFECALNCLAACGCVSERVGEYARACATPHKQMTDAFPHVARRRDRIEPSGECTPEEARKRLGLLKPLLEELGVKLNRPGLLSPLAIDSIGTLLCPPASGPMAASNPMAERYRVLLTENPPDGVTFRFPRVRLQLRTHETISVDDAEQLETRKRLGCVAIRGTEEVARRLDPDERALSDLVIELDDKGTSVVVREQKDPMHAVVYLSPASEPNAQKKTKRPNILEARLHMEKQHVLSALFHGSGKGRLAQLRPDPMTAQYLPPLPPASDGGHHLLPIWMTEHLATLAQDLLRLHVLVTAAVPQGRSRMLYFDRASVYRNSDPQKFQHREHTLIRCPLHAASSSCVCELHGKTPKTQFQSLELRIELCGGEFETQAGRRCCKRHFEAEVQECSLFRGLCTRCLKVELWCRHERTTKDAPSVAEGGLRIGMTDLLLKSDSDLPKPPPGEWMLESVRQIVACACSLARPEHSGTRGATAVAELKADADGVMAALDHECHARGHVDAQLGALDETCVWLLRRGGGKYARRSQKIEMDSKRKLPGDPPCVSKTHGHLFRVQR
jgi:hypothetical protein